MIFFKQNHKIKEQESGIEEKFHFGGKAQILQHPRNVADSIERLDFFFYPHRPAAPISVRGGMVNKEKASGRIME